MGKKMKSYTKADQLNKTKKPRKKKCPECKEWFEPKREFQVVCGEIKCAVSHGKKTLKQIHNKAKKEFNENDTKWLKVKAKDIVHEYVRLRDRNLPCVSCGTYKAKWDAGHYKSAGGNSKLKFNTLNIHKQCYRCNCELSSNPIPYRIELIKRIGLAKVEEFESNRTSRKYNAEYLKKLIKVFRKKVKNLKRKIKNQGA